MSGDLHVRRAQLAKITDMRRAERRIVNLAVTLREGGAVMADADVLNLSETGYMAETDMPLEAGASVFLKLPGQEIQRSEVVWVEGRRAGFEFTVPLHPATLELLTAGTRKAPVRNHFGPRGLR